MMSLNRRRHLSNRSRSSHRRCSVTNGVLRNFAKITGKHLRQGLFFNKVADLRPATLLKKRLWHWCFPVNFAKFLRTPFFTEHLWVTASVGGAFTVIYGNSKTQINFPI